MSKIVLYIAQSLDGKIARKDGTLDWSESLPNPQQIDHGYHEFLSRISTTLMGRKTYDKILSFGIEWVYADLQSYVVGSILKINCFFSKYKSDGTSDATWLKKHFRLSITKIWKLQALTLI